MANISFFARLSNIWKGFMSLWLTDLEVKNPEIAYQNAIDSMIENYTQLKSTAAAIIRRREEIAARLDKTNSELAAIKRDLEAALSTNQDELGIILIQKKNALEAELKGLTDDFAIAQKDADDAKDSLLQVKNEIQNLKDEKDRMLAKMHSAQARLKIQGQLDGLSVDAEVRALDNVREHIKNTVAEANMNQEIHSADLDVQLNKLRQGSGAVLAQQELEAMKAARNQTTEENASKNI